MSYEFGRPHAFVSKDFGADNALWLGQGLNEKMK